MLYMLSLFDKKPQKKYVVAASAILAVILIIRFSYVLLIPALILSFAIPHALLTIAAFTISFLGLKALPMLLASGNNLIPEASGITSGTHQNYIYRSFIDLGGHKLYLFIFIFILIFLWSLERRDYINKLNKQLMFSLLSALTFLGFFATTYFHPQYITWLMPFFLLPILNDKNNFLWKTLWIFIPFYLLYLLNWKNATTFGLAAPISIVFYHIDPNDFIPILDITRWVNIARTAISGFFIYWIYYIFKYYGKTR